MSFIIKQDPVVIEIKLTSLGREQLASGSLNFNYFVVGDSEIDYNFINKNNYSISKLSVLRPLDLNPSILSYVPSILSGNSYNSLGYTTSDVTAVQNSTNEAGFFVDNGNKTYNIITDTSHIYQSDMIVYLKNVKVSNSSTNLYINKASTYGTNINEPKIGQYLLVNWTNPYNSNTTGFTITTSIIPSLWYKIINIVSGSLGGNNLIVTVDRPLPDFSGYNGNIDAGVICYDNKNNDISGTTYSSDFINNSIFDFFNNTTSISDIFPFWNLSIIFTDSIAGIQLTGKTIGNYNSATYAGFVSYIQNQAPINKKLGVIHYTNESPQNVYGESLFYNTPVLKLPTIMWHKNKTKGLVLSALGQIKLLTGNTLSLNTRYYDLADNNNIVVGKIFPDLKLFIIEDQELLFAMSFKSNRNWTLPSINLNLIGI